MSLVTYIDARPWARSIKNKVMERAMPPWGADLKFGAFANQPTITDAERSLLAAWVDAGAPEGGGTAPTPPSFLEGWSSQMGRPPDRILEAPFGEFELPASGEIPVFTTWQRVPFRDDVFIEALELRPTNRLAIHHASISLGTLPPRTKVGRGVLWPDGPMLDGVRLDKNGEPYRTMSNEEFGYPMLFYVPGGGFLKLPAGVAKRIRSEQYLSWGIHAITTGRPQRVGMRLGLWYAKKSVYHEALTMTANVRNFVDGRELLAGSNGRTIIPKIPAGASDWTITGVISFPDAVTLYALWPHMHLRGKSMTFVLRYPNGQEVTLLSVPKYDFHWQVTYELSTPMKIPGGSTIIATAHYDNSPQNRFNPDPDHDVVWGEQSWNEMFNPFLEVTVDKDDLRYSSLR